MTREELNGVTPQFLNFIFLYRDGKLFWKVAGGNWNIGDIAGYLSSDNRIYTTINGVQYPIARLIYIMLMDEYPIVVDHIDGNTLNNTIENLQSVTYQENSRKARVSKNVTYYPGVKRIKDGRWSAQIRVNNRVIMLGYFDTALEAGKERFKAEDKYYGKFIPIDRDRFLMSLAGEE